MLSSFHHHQAAEIVAIVSLSLMSLMGPVADLLGGWFLGAEQASMAPLGPAEDPAPTLLAEPLSYIAPTGMDGIQASDPITLQHPRHSPWCEAADLLAPGMSDPP